TSLKTYTDARNKAVDDLGKLNAEMTAMTKKDNWIIVALLPQFENQKLMVELRPSKIEKALSVVLALRKELLNSLGSWFFHIDLVFEVIVNGQMFPQACPLLEYMVG
ncbi:10800_t:CDS:2, partial [Gigaspora rosea]